MLDWSLVTEQAASDKSLRGMTDRVQKLFQTIERRKFQ